MLAFVSLGSLIYTTLVCSIPRFHTSLHLLSVNVSLALFVASSFWIIYFTMTAFYFNLFWTEKSCLLILYLQTMITSQLVNSLCVASLNRLFAVLYHSKALFQTKRWVATCICIQWIYGLVIAAPLFRSSLAVSDLRKQRLSCLFLSFCSSIVSYRVLS